MDNDKTADLLVKTLGMLKMHEHLSYVIRDMYKMFRERNSILQTPYASFEKMHDETTEMFFESMQPIIDEMMKSPDGDAARNLYEKHKGHVKKFSELVDET